MQPDATACDIGSMVPKKREQKYPQLQHVRLGPDYVWIAGALAQQPEGMSGAVRVLLLEVLGSKGRRDLDLLYMGKPRGKAASLSPVRLVAGYEHLPEVIDLTAKQCGKRLGYEVEGSDVLRTALWDGLVTRGVKAPPRPLNVYVEVLKRPTSSSLEIAAATGLPLGAIHNVRAKLGLFDAEYAERHKPMSAAKLRVALSKGLTQVEAAARCGVSQKTIAKVRAAHGYTVDHRKARKRKKSQE